SDHSEGRWDCPESVAAELADHRGGVGADHDELAMRHVNDTGDPEHDRQADSCDNQDRHHAEPAHELRHDRLKHHRSDSPQPLRLAPASSSHKVKYGDGHRSMSIAASM